MGKARGLAHQLEVVADTTAKGCRESHQQPVEVPLAVADAVPTQIHDQPGDQHHVDGVERHGSGAGGRLAQAVGAVDEPALAIEARHLQGVGLGVHAGQRQGDATFPQPAVQHLERGLALDGQEGQHGAGARELRQREQLLGDGQRALAAHLGGHGGTQRAHLVAQRALRLLADVDVEVRVVRDQRGGVRVRRRVRGHRARRRPGVGWTEPGCAARRPWWRAAPAPRPR